MKSKSTLKYHLLLGFVIVLMDVFSNYVYLGHERFFLLLTPGGVLLKTTFLITFFSIYALNYRLVCPKVLSKRSKLSFLGALMLLILAFAGIRYLLEEVLVFQWTGQHNYYKDKRVFGYYVFDNSYYAIKALLFSTLMYLFFNYIRNKDETQAAAMEAQKSIFQQQIRELLKDVRGETLEKTNAGQSLKKITVKVGKTASFVEVDSIKHISASGSYIDVKTTDKSYVLRTSLDGILGDINDSKFIRIHRSTVINMDFVDKLVYSNHGEVDAKMQDGTLFRVGNSYKKEFLKRIGG